jgi:flagellar M-ring protein FliF
MSSVDQGATPSPISIISKLPVGRIVLIAMAVLVISLIVVFFVSVSQSPTKQMLFSGLSPQEVPEILAVLEGNGIDYKMQGQDTILIPSRDIGPMKMELATKGLPRGGSRGYDTLGSASANYGKTNMEQYVLYKKIYEQEISDAIKTLDSVQFAKVLLAIPKSSRMIRNKGVVKANITVVTWNSQKLSQDQVNGIVKIVVDSVPQLDMSNVSLVDQTGKQLNIVDEEGGVSSVQLDYVQSIENKKSGKITRLVEAFVGIGNVKVAVTADVDFSHREIRSDDWDSTDKNVRSSQQSSSQNGQVSGGVPGSMSNQPPSAGMAPETVLTNESIDGDGSLVRDSVINYEVDKSSMYEIRAKGSLVRQTLSVVVANKRVDDGEGGFVYKPRTKEEITRIELLIKNSVGFSSDRGDQLYVSSEEFMEDKASVIINNEGPEFWEQSWVSDAVHQVLSLVGLCILFFGIIRPTMRKTSETVGLERAHQLALAQEKENMMETNKRRAKQMKDAETPEELYKQHVEDVEKLISEDGKRVQQILKNWMSNGDLT